MLNKFTYLRYSNPDLQLLMLSDRLGKLRNYERTKNKNNTSRYQQNYVLVLRVNYIILFYFILVSMFCVANSFLFFFLYFFLIDGDSIK